MLIHIEVEVQHVSGKFAAKDAVFEALAEMLDTGEINVDEATYEVASVEMGADPAPRGKKETKNADRA